LVLADCLFARVSLALVPPDTTAANSIYRMSNVDVATLPLEDSGSSPRAGILSAKALFHSAKATR
jgi:hypothetical protein